jgi:hypothetical protein
METGIEQIVADALKDEAELKGLKRTILKRWFMNIYKDCMFYLRIYSEYPFNREWYDDSIKQNMK